uniref:Uncharacterized protein n=1 Tax=Anopheles stephensi TaxID=30069 RepID=A0A182YSN8_ANOST
MLLVLIAIATAVSAEGLQGNSNGYNYPTPTPPSSFNGYDYPKPSKPFHGGYNYKTPDCPLVLPSTTTVTDYKTKTLPPSTTTSVLTSYITLPPVVRTEFSTIFSTRTTTEVSVSTTVQLVPTTVTSLIKTTYCQPNTYLPPPTPPPPSPPPNTYLPVEPPSKEYLPQHQGAAAAPNTNVAGISTVVRQSDTSGNSGGFISTFVQQQSGPIKRATVGDPARLEPTLSSERSEANEIIPSEESSGQPAINIIYIDRNGVSEGKPPAGLMNWLLCKFNLSSGSCSDN